MRYARLFANDKPHLMVTVENHFGKSEIGAKSVPAKSVPDTISSILNDFAVATGISASNERVCAFRAREALRKQVARSCGTCAEHGCLDCSCGRCDTER